MRVVKIIIGLGLLYATSKEYISASIQLGSFVKAPIVAVLFFVLICTWLIGSGFLNRKLKRIDFLKSFFATSLFFGVFTCINLLLFIAPKDIVEINGLKIPLGKCIDGNRRIIPNDGDRKLYCRCFIEKIINNPELRVKYQNDLENDKANKVFDQIQREGSFKELEIGNCMKAVGMKWTDDLANSMKNNWKKELIGTKLEDTNDLDKYCNCVISEFRKYPLNEVMEDAFSESNAADLIREKCINESKK